MTGNAMLGAFARIFARPTASDLVDAFIANDLTQVQLNLNALGYPTIPLAQDLSTEDLDRIGREFSSRGTALWGISTTYNTAHPDPERRVEETRRAVDFIARLGGTTASAATLCSGSRNPSNMWGMHPETGSEHAWVDFRTSLDELLAAAARSDIRLAIEPEPANVVADIDSALRLQRELGSDSHRIGFILDPANLVTGLPRESHQYMLERAFSELAESTICVHAKDTVEWSTTLSGRGVVDYDLVAMLYDGLPRPVPLIIQDASEKELPAVANLIRSALFEERRERTR